MDTLCNFVGVPIINTLPVVRPMPTPKGDGQLLKSFIVGRLHNLAIVGD
jgi:hypothetical protein